MKTKTSEEYQIRLKKLKELKQKGINPYEYSYEVDATPEIIKKNYEEFEGKETSCAGRIISIRDFGKALFADLMGERDKLQIYLKKEVMGENFDFFKKFIDIGDIVGVKGKVQKTKTGEVTLFISEIKLLTKVLHPLPEKYHGLKNPEIRYRMRYLDLIADPRVREIFIKRTEIFNFIKNFLDKRGFLEVETPILQPVYGGASARPFTTYANTLDTHLFLRISNELYLKRLIIGGFERVYEFSKDFRNEGIDKSHYPEFTLLEAYIAYKDYYFLIDFIEELLYSLVNEVCGSYTISYQGKEISFQRPFERIYFTDALENNLKVKIEREKEDEIRKKAIEIGIYEVKDLPYHKMLDKLLDELIVKKIINPSFILDYPIETSPLAKIKRGNERLTERFEIAIAGLEIVNAFSELNDPADQRERFIEQTKFRELGDEDAQVFDEDFITALEYGMPPTAGFGIGMDRLCMLLTNSQNIRDVILFPQIKPKL